MIAISSNDALLPDAAHDNAASDRAREMERALLARDDRVAVVRELWSSPLYECRQAAVMLLERGWRLRERLLTGYRDKRPVSWG